MGGRAQGVLPRGRAAGCHRVAHGQSRQGGERQGSQSGLRGGQERAHLWRGGVLLEKERKVVRSGERGWQRL
eukprot:277111-Prymnesium_polylepis.2